MSTIQWLKKLQTAVVCVFGRFCSKKCP